MNQIAMRPLNEIGRNFVDPKYLTPDSDSYRNASYTSLPDWRPLTRRERAENVRKRNYFTKYGEQARIVLNALLDKYADEGIVNIEDIKVLKIKPVSDLGTPTEIISAFGSKDDYINAVHELEEHLYSETG